MTTHTDHPARTAAALVAAVARLDSDTDPARFRGSPIVANRIAMTAAWDGYTAGRSSAISELKTTADVAAILGVSVRRVQALAHSRGVGWQVSRGTWLFRAEDVDAMRDRSPGRPSG